MIPLLDRINEEIRTRKPGDPVREAMIAVKKEAYLLQTRELANHEREEALRQALEAVADSSEGEALSYLRDRYVPKVEWASDAEISRLLEVYKHQPLKIKVRQVMARLQPKKVNPADIHRLLKARR